MDLTEAFFMKIAGWEAVKRGRFMLEQRQVLSANWTPPVLKGVVQDGPLSLRATLIIKSESDIENNCSCRQARESGTICAHVVAVGLRLLRAATEAQNPAPAGLATAPPSAARPAKPAPATSRVLTRAAEGQAAAEVEICIILPPNLEQAVTRGKVMLCLEGRWSGGRSPLAALPKSQPFRFSAQDRALLDRMETLAGGETPSMLMVSASDFASLLPTLAEHPRVTSGRATEIEIARTPLPLPIKATLEAEGEIALALRSRPGPAPVFFGGGWSLVQNRLAPVGLSPERQGLLAGSMRVSRAQVPQFLSQEWPSWQASGTVEANFRLEDFSLETKPPQFLLELKGGLAQLHALLQCAYGPRILTLGVSSDAESFWLPDPQAPTRYSTRDLEAEHAAVSRLRRVGFTGPDGQGRYQLVGQNQVLNFFAREYPRLQKAWKVTLEERLERSTAQNLERVEPQFSVTPSGVQWFDLEVAFTTREGERFSAADIQRLVLSGQNHTRLKSGRIALIDTGAVAEFQETLLDCLPQQHAQGYRVSQAQAGFLEATLRQQGWTVKAPPAWRDRVRRQTGDAQLECPPLGDLEPVLRDYQKTGVAWLGFLRDNGFGGILADEMGLGKTLQALAFLQCAVKVEPNAAGGSLRLPFLVVCPTSLVFNWVAEARKFTPRLRVLAVQGPERQAEFEKIPHHDLVVTSYALIRRDADRYRGLEFDTVILDEAQHIKNRQTQNALAVKGIRARHRLVLTGTPLENSVLDLWSIFDFLMPGYLGSANDFRERYEQPITRDRNVEAQARLGRRLRPFILRRTKSEVATELPAKIEQISFCDLTDDQRAAYQQVLEAGRQEVLATAGAEGEARSRLVVLTTLLRLRQICCDLRLLQLENVNPANASGKLDLFGELLEEALDGGHRLLVFSQFVTMLSLLREKLESQGIEFCYLDGSTRDRAAVVEKFQTGQVPVFLISLKAGGTGLNLAAADTVVHFDPWWNPAVEQQATDRAHRIGQTSVVTSYKLIARGTVEEKILTLQARKREVIQATLGGEESLAQALTWDEIQELLA